MLVSQLFSHVFYIIGNMSHHFEVLKKAGQNLLKYLIEMFGINQIFKD